MQSIRYGVMVLLLVVVVVPAAGPVRVRAQGVSDAPPDFMTLITAGDVMQHIKALAGDIGARRAGSEEEAQTAAYIADQLAGWGYAVALQEFETDAWSEDDEFEGEIISQNVIATRAGRADATRMIVVGAHMDSVDAGTGAGDNASGVAAMLAVAEALAGFDTAYTLVFIAFGAEESGDPSGAAVYVESLGDDIEQVIAMINIDSVGIGTDLNVYAGAIVGRTGADGSSQFTGGPVWVRDLALALADEMGLSFTTTPPESWNGFTGDWSDHYAFVEAGVPVAYFEAWQWIGPENLWWGQETPEGDYLHTRRDVIENVVPEKVERVAAVVAATVYEIGFTAEGAKNAE
ncbi:MAG: M20/M25/M40 family metallo-hydrolase [Anaerolineae bacterium]|nr:M20/M25/M40 family metallo-hydrolase [Anaerolineae bacterium]